MLILIFKNHFFKAAVTTNICSSRSGPYCPMALPFCFRDDFCLSGLLWRLMQACVTVTEHLELDAPQWVIETQEHDKNKPT